MNRLLMTIVIVSLLSVIQGEARNCGSNPSVVHLQRGQRQRVQFWTDQPGTDANNTDENLTVESANAKTDTTEPVDPQTSSPLQHTSPQLETLSDSQQKFESRSDVAEVEFESSDSRATAPINSQPQDLHDSSLVQTARDQSPEVANPVESVDDQVSALSLQAESNNSVIVHQSPRVNISLDIPPISSPLTIDQVNNEQVSESLEGQALTKNSNSQVTVNDKTDQVDIDDPTLKAEQIAEVSQTTQTSHDVTENQPAVAEVTEPCVTIIKYFVDSSGKKVFLTQSSTGHHQQNADHHSAQSHSGSEFPEAITDHPNQSEQTTAQTNHDDGTIDSHSEEFQPPENIHQEVVDQNEKSAAQNLMGKPSAIKPDQLSSSHSPVTNQQDSNVPLIDSALINDVIPERFPSDMLELMRPASDDAPDHLSSEQDATTLVSVETTSAMDLSGTMEHTTPPIIMEEDPTTPFPQIVEPTTEISQNLAPQSDIMEPVGLPVSFESSMALLEDSNFDSVQPTTISTSISDLPDEFLESSLETKAIDTTPVSLPFDFTMQSSHKSVPPITNVNTDILSPFPSNDDARDKIDDADITTTQTPIEAVTQLNQDSTIETETTTTALFAPASESFETSPESLEIESTTILPPSFEPTTEILQQPTSFTDQLENDENDDQQTDPIIPLTISQSEQENDENPISIQVADVNDSTDSPPEDATVVPTEEAPDTTEMSESDENEHFGREDALIWRIRNIVDSLSKPRDSLIKRTSGFLQSVGSVFRRPRQTARLDPFFIIQAPDLSGQSDREMTAEQEDVYRTFIQNVRGPNWDDDSVITGKSPKPTPDRSNDPATVDVQVSGFLPFQKTAGYRPGVAVDAAESAKSSSTWDSRRMPDDVVQRIRRSDPTLLQFIYSRPLPLRRALSSDPRAAKKIITPKSPTECDMHIKTEPGLYLLITFHNMSAPHTVDCSGAFIEIERENNGFEAKWCGNQIEQARAGRSQVIFARSEVRISVFDDGRQHEERQWPTGFTADVEVVDLHDAGKYSSFQRSEAYSSVQRQIG